MLTPLLYRPWQVWYFSFQKALLVVTISESNIWILMIMVQLLFSMWHPMFLEDLVSWSKSVSMGFTIVILLCFGIMYEHHINEKITLGFILVYFLYLFIPNLHALVRIGSPTRVVMYEERKSRSTADIKAVTV